MKKQFAGIIALAAFFFVACSNKESASSIAKEWCELNGKVAKAKTDDERMKAQEKRKAFEDKIEAKYKEDTAMRNAVMMEVEKCEDASEGR